MSRGWAKASACRLQITLSCAFLCHIVSLQYLSRSTLHRLAAWSPLSSFLVILWSPSGDTRGTSVVFEAVDMPCPGPFHFFYSVDYIYDFCPLPDPDVGLSTFVCDVEHTSFHFGLGGRKFVLCLFCQCPGFCTTCHSWQHTGVVHLSLQTDGKVAFEDVPVFGVCCPACHDSSLYLLLYTVPWTFSISTVFTFIGVLSTTITFVFAMFILRPIRLLSSDSSCSICCSSCGVPVHRNMSSAKRRLERNSPSIFTPLFSQLNLLNMLSSVAVNSLGEMVFPCLTPLLILIFSLSLCIYVLSLSCPYI